LLGNQEIIRHKVKLTLEMPILEFNYLYYKIHFIDVRLLGV